MAATGARHPALVDGWGFEFEQLAHAYCARLMQGYPKSALHGFQIHATHLAALGKDTAQ
jgi:hypothetical protein